MKKNYYSSGNHITCLTFKHILRHCERGIFSSHRNLIPQSKSLIFINVFFSESEELENAESQSETEKPETEVEESGSQSGSGLGGFDPDLEEDFLDLDVDDLLL